MKPEKCNEAPAAARISALCSLDLRLLTRGHCAAAAGIGGGEQEGGEVVGKDVVTTRVGSKKEKRTGRE